MVNQPKPAPADLPPLPHTDSVNPWQTRTINTVYENPWIRLTHRDVINPSGNPGIYGVVHFKNTAIGIVPLDEAGNTWLVGQYRYTLNSYSWEIPEGGGPSGTDVLASAQRELLEETGIRAAKWTSLGDMYLSNSVSDEYGTAFVAQELSFEAARPEETEQLEVIRIPFSQALEYVMTGAITDALSIIAILKTNLLLQRGELIF